MTWHLRRTNLGDWVTDLLFRSGRPNRPVRFVFLLIFVSPVIVMAVLSYFRISQDLKALALSRRQAVVYLASRTVKADLDRLRDIGISLATRVRFRQLVGEGRWNEAIRILEGVPQSFPFIDRIFLSDRKGTLKADTPALPNVRGMDFSYRDWYRGVSETWRPYISEVYRRAAQPQANVFAVAVPIESAPEAVTGILVLQVRLSKLLAWTQRSELGPGGIVRVVDRKGHLAVHPRYESDGEIIDLAGLDPIQKALRGERGIEILRSPDDGEKRVYAYEPVPEYGWAVISEQPATLAFATPGTTLRNMMCVYIVLLFFSVLLTCVILRALIEKKRSEDQIRRLNENLNRRAAELDATNKELEAFSYSVSHDLRAPLRSIDGFSQALLERSGQALDEQAKRHLARVRAATQRMGQLIDDLLGLSRVTRTEIRRARVDLSDLARRVAEALRKSQPARQMAVSIEEGISAQGDERLLRILLENLMGNAWKFTRDRVQGRIEFGRKLENGGPEFFVRDNGAGFDMAYAGKLFGAFQRLHSAQHFEGTGIGLATVARIVRRHGGHVRAEGAVNGGATFYFTL